MLKFNKLFPFNDQKNEHMPLGAMPITLNKNTVGVFVRP